MACDKRHFLDFLCGFGTVNVLFEPFLSHTHAETLIWRRGSHLWDTAEHTLDTLTYLTERTQTDMVFADIRALSDDSKNEMLAAVTEFREKSALGYGIICDSKDIPLCESVCDCLCVYGDGMSSKVPIIRMDGSVGDAVSRGDCGWYCREEAEKYLAEYGDKIRILGGLGINTIVGGSPVKIYARVERTAHEYRGKWACGSGGMIPDENYLELISLLGAFARIR